MNAHDKGRPSVGQIYGGKIKLVQFARRQLRMAEEDYRALLLRAGGVISCKGLTLKGFDAVMDEFHRLGFVHAKSTQMRIPTNVTDRTDERDRWRSADAWCSNSNLTGHDGRAQGCPQATASAPLTLAGGRLWGTRVWRADFMIFPPCASTRRQV